MYPYSPGSKGYDQQQQQLPYSSQSAYPIPTLGTDYSGSQTGGRDADGSSQLSGASHHLRILGGMQEEDTGGYRGHRHPSRRSDYGVPRATSLRHTAQDHHQAEDPTTFATRLDPMYVHASSNPGYGISLTPGGDYGVRKGLRSTICLQVPDYPSPRMVSRIDDLKDGRLAYNRELEWRGKECEEQCECEKNRVREIERERKHDREQERERDRQRVWEWEREREKARERECREKDLVRGRKTKCGAKHERTPPRLSRERQGTSLPEDGKYLQRKSSREASHRPLSIVKDRRREYVCKAKVTDGA